MAKLICFKNHIPVKGVFAARKGAHFAYLEITSQQRAFFRPGECRGEHQGTTGRTLVRNLSSARRTRSPPVLWLLFWECDYGNMQNSYWGKQSPPSENAMSPRFWLQFLIIILHFELGTKQQYLCCICFWRFLAMDHLTTTLRWSYLRWDNKATTMIESCREGPPVQGTPASLPSQYSSLANMCYCQSRDHSILLNMLSTVHCSCSSTSRSDGLSNLHKPGRNQQASPHPPWMAVCSDLEKRFWSSCFS